MYFLRYLSLTAGLITWPFWWTRSCRRGRPGPRFIFMTFTLPDGRIWTETENISMTTNISMVTTDLSMNTEWNSNSILREPLDTTAPLWFIHTCCLRDCNQDRDEWVVWFYVKPFTLGGHVNLTWTWTLLHTAWREGLGDGGSAGWILPEPCCTLPGGRDLMMEALVGESYLDPAAHCLEGGTWWWRLWLGTWTSPDAPLAPVPSTMQSSIFDFTRSRSLSRTFLY